MDHSISDSREDRSSRSSSTEWSCDEVEEFGALSINAKPKPTKKYPAKLHARNVAKHLDVEHGLIYLQGLPSKLYDDSDQMEVFRQRRYFYYLSGVNLPDCVVTYNIQEDRLTAFIPPLNTGRSVIYLGQNPTPEEMKSKYDFDEVVVISSLVEFLDEFTRKELGRIYVLYKSQSPASIITQPKLSLSGHQSSLTSEADAYIATEKCRYCRRRKIRCYAQSTEERCLNCKRFQQECVPVNHLPPANSSSTIPTAPGLDSTDAQWFARQSSLLKAPEFSGNHNSLLDTTKLRVAMDASRVIKTPYELEMIRKASAISALGHTNVLRGIKYISNEAEIEAIFTATCIAEQAKQQSYGVIAASGENASTLHYMANNEPLEGRQLVCLDAGCDWQCYASDVTRTFPINGEYSKEAQQIYDIVEEMQESCINMIQPGANFREIHMHAHTVAASGLIDLGILHNGSFEDIFKSGATSAFFLHGLGHFMGLEVHDVGDGGNLLLGKTDSMLYGTQEESWLTLFHEMLQDMNANSASILAPNQVITVEPGIYFSRYALELFRGNTHISKYINWPILEKYYPVGGVRIEDDILVTEDGYENLTTAPKGQAALDIINGREEEEKEDVVEEKIEKRKGWFW